MNATSWQKKVVPPEKVLEEIHPGMTIFVGTGLAEPRTLVKTLLSSNMPNLRDLELVQIMSFGDPVSIEERYPKKYRLKTFHSGWVASEAVSSGRVDLIPCNFSRIPRLIRSGMIRIDVAFVQITPPDESGYSSLGVAVDAARQAMEKATLVVGEISPHIPRTLGDTHVHIDEFNYLVETTEPAFLLDRWPVDPIINKVALNVASMIEDGSCISFSTGHLFECLGRHLQSKRHLGLHSPFITDPAMDLIKSGAITNRLKTSFRGTSLVSYALGTAELMRWLDRNPLVEFQGIDVVGSPAHIGMNDRYMAIMPVRKVDLTGRVAMHVGRSNVAFAMGEVQEILAGVQLSRGGRIICAVTSRNLAQQANIRFSIDEFPSQITLRESMDMVATEYGVAELTGRSVRERAMALIDIAHPDDRAELIRQAKEGNLIYPDQIYLSEAGRFYPEDVATEHTFKNNLTVRFRAIKPSDEDEMRRLFYRFSDEAVYYRYFSPIKTMPHTEMQPYVNVDYNRIMSIVGVIGPVGAGHIIAEARYVREPGKKFADTAFIVDEAYSSHGIATFLYELLMDIARKHGIQGFTADVLATNKGMLKVYEKAPFPVKSVLSEGVYSLTIPFAEQTWPATQGPLPASQAAPGKAAGWDVE